MGTTLLETGKILVAFSNGESAIWDPDSGSFARRPSPPTSGSGSRTPSPTDILDVLTQPWSRVEAQPAVGANAAMYQPGHILRSGGLAQTGQSGSAVRTTSVIDMTGPSPRWRETGSMAFARAFHNLTVLPDGRVLAVGGAAGSPDAGVPVTAAEMWDPSTGAWTTLAAMNTPRVPPAASLLLPDGRVLVTGADSTGRTSAELFSPPYLFKGPRPSIADAPAVLESQADGLVRTIGPEDVAAVSLIGAGDVSQTFDQGQRFIALPFRRVQEGVEITVPDSRAAPPGVYQLFLLNRDGVPSDGTLVTLTTGTATVPPVATAAEPPIAAGVARGLAIDAIAGNTTTSADRFVAASNADTTAPTVSISAPAANATVSGTTVTVSATASDNVGVVGVRFRLDGVNLGSEDKSSPYSRTWNSTTATNGLHTLTAVARDKAGNITSAAVTVTVDNAGPPPASTPTVIGTQIGGTFGDATGHSAQSHLVYATNSGVWWLFTLTSAADSGSNHVVKSFRSSGPDLATATWSPGADSPGASGIGVMGSGRALGVAYLDNNAVDVIHADLSMAAEGQEGTTAHIRATVSGTSITWGTWDAYVEGAATWTQPRGNTIGVSTGKAIHTGGAILQQEVDANVRTSNNADTGSTWNSGFSGVSVIDNSMINASNAMAFAALANNVMLSVYDNGGGTSTCYNCGQKGAPEPDLTNLGYKKSNADGSWPGVSVGGQGPGDGHVFSSDATINQNDWCLVPVSVSNIYVFRKNAAGTAIDAATYQVGSNNWAVMSPAPPALGGGHSVKSGAGLFGATDGTSVWLFFVDTDAADTIRYSRFNGSSWSAWAPVPGTDTGTHTRNYLSGHPRAANGQIGLIWTEGTSSFDTVTTALIISGPQAMSVTPSGARMAAGPSAVMSTPSLALADRHLPPASDSRTFAHSAWLERASRFNQVPPRIRSRAPLDALSLVRR